ncbi:MAG: peptidoglycan recognition family protein [Ignavibacteriales bacterium]|nr:peptidoglycan recognition family protein [Ignavibacteriales bacterium]
MSFREKYTVFPMLLPLGSKRRGGSKLDPGVKFLVAHDTGNPRSTARNNVSYFQRSCNEMSASAHLFVDDKEILECIPALTGPPEKAWHVLYNVTTDNQMFGYDANNAAIGVEYCYGSNIQADEAYNKYVWVLAYLCYKFGLDPANKIIGHCFLDPRRKTDPVTGLLQSRRTYDQLLKDVATEFAVCSGLATPGLNITKQAGTVEVTHTLNIRQGQPNTRVPIVQTVPPHARLSYTGWTNDGEKVLNISKWYKNAQGNFFWSGGVV